MVAPYVEMLAAEPHRFVAGRELEIEFEAERVPLVAKIDRVSADAVSLEAARDLAIMDYKTVTEATPRGLSLQGAITKGEEIRLVTYYQAFLARYGKAPSYLGKIFLKHRSKWRPGTLLVLLRVTETAPAKGDPFYGRQGHKMTDRAWVSSDQLEVAWSRIREQIRSIFKKDLARFEITPSKDVCKYCAFQTVCGKEDHAGASDL